MTRLHRLFGHEWVPARWIKDARGTRWVDACSCGAQRVRDSIDLQPDVDVRS